MMSQTSWKTCRVEKESMNRDYKQPQPADGPAPIPEQHPPDTAEEGLLLHAVRWRWLLNRENKCFNSNTVWSGPAEARGFTSTCVLINGIKKTSAVSVQVRTLMNLHRFTERATGKIYNQKLNNHFKGAVSVSGWIRACRHFHLPAPVDMLQEGSR